MKKKIYTAVAACLLVCCAAGFGIWAAISSVATVKLGLPAVTKETFWGEVSISLDGYRIESDEDKIDTFVQKINYNEEAASVIFELPNRLEFDVDEYGGPKPIVVTFELKINGYMGVSKDSGITITISDEISGISKDCFEITPTLSNIIDEEGEKSFVIESREAFENNANNTLVLEYTIVQTAIYETPKDDFILPADLEISITFATAT